MTFILKRIEFFLSDQITNFRKKLKVYNALKDYNQEPSVITIGTFDGVHLGHKKIIERLCKFGQHNQLNSLILTFFPHPRMVLNKDYNLKLLNTIEEKKNRLEALGVNALVIEPFTLDFANLSAKDFVKTVLVDQLNAKHIIIGYDHRFGKNRTANIDDLKLYGASLGFTVEEIPAEDIEAVSISSTKIRNALNEGFIKKANRYLGDNYKIQGQVIKGKGIGKSLNYPTANIQVNSKLKLIPKQGVYIIKCLIDKTFKWGMINIGINPTFNTSKLSIEVHFLDYNNDLYGKTLNIELLKHLRDEKKFNSIDELKNQIMLDESQTRDFIKNHA